MKEPSEDRPVVADGLDVHEVDDGFVVYDPANDRVHYLNPTATVILSACDGTRPVSQLAAVVRDAWQLDDLPTEEVAACVAQLRHEGILR